MPNYLNLLNRFTGAMFVAAVLCACWVYFASSDQRNIRLLARAFAGLALMSFGIGDILKELHSPRIVSDGFVTNFRQVKETRNSYFAFRIGGKDPELTSHYFDKGFYFGDPAMSDGDHVVVTYSGWTNTVISIRETAGHHPGWSYETPPGSVGPRVFVVAGFFVLVFAIGGKITDSMAAPQSESGILSPSGDQSRDSTHS